MGDAANELKAETGASQGGLGVLVFLGLAVGLVVVVELVLQPAPEATVAKAPEEVRGQSFLAPSEPPAAPEVEPKGAEPEPPEVAAAELPVVAPEVEGAEGPEVMDPSEAPEVEPVVEPAEVIEPAAEVPPNPEPSEPKARDLAAKDGEVEVERSGGQTTVRLPGPPPAALEKMTAPTGRSGSKAEDGSLILGFDMLGGYEYIPQPAGIPLEKLPKQIPDALLAYDGKRVQVSGFMLPIDVGEDGDVHMFFLMRDLASCCFGGTPKMNEWVLVEAGSGFRTKYTGYAAIAVTGRIAIGEKVEYGRVTSIYRVEGEAITVLE